MANLIRSAKSRSDWTLNDLDSYHISLNQADALTLFDLQELPQPSVDEELLAKSDASAMQQDRHAELITYLGLAMIPAKGEPAAIDFVGELFKILGYVRRERVARTRMNLPFFICGENRHAKADICLVDRSQNDILRLVQAEKRLELGKPASARVQLVTEAVGAFNENNAQREAIGLPPLVEKIIPGIVMVGTSPVFFKIPVTQTLSVHIRHGTYPPEETRVTYCYPPVPRPAHRRSEGMKPLDNEAFKVIAGI